MQGLAPKSAKKYIIVAHITRKKIASVLAFEGLVPKFPQTWPIHSNQRLHMILMSKDMVREEVRIDVEITYLFIVKFVIIWTRKLSLSILFSSVCVGLLGSRHCFQCYHIDLIIITPIYNIYLEDLVRSMDWYIKFLDRIRMAIRSFAVMPFS